MQFARVIAFLFLLVGYKAYSQKLTIQPDLRFENFNEEGNFTSSYIGSVTIDNKGYLWAVGNGLFRFDGVRLER